MTGHDVAVDAGISGGRRRVTWAVALAAIALFVATEAIDPLADPTAVILFGSSVVSLVLVGAVLATRVPGNPIGGWLLVAGTLVSVGAATGVVATVLSRSASGTDGLAPWLALVNQVLFFFPIVLVIVIVPLHFPDGRLPSPGWRWVVRLTIVGMTLDTVVNLFRAGAIGAALLPNPLAAPAWLQPLIDVLNTLTLVIALPVFLGAAASVVARYRRARSVERAQLRWLMADASAAAVTFPISLIVPNQVVSNVLFALGFAAIAALPVAIGIAILRYRLYDIDRLISRTIGWAIVTGAVVTVYLAAVLALQAVLGGLTRGDTLVVAASTLVAAALIQPIRRRVQATIDRRFDRRRFDADRAVAAFAGRVRDEVAIDGVADELRRTVIEAIKPEAFGLWVRGEGG